MKPQKILVACAVGLLSLGAASQDAPSAIRLNQLGFVPGVPIHAIFAHPSTRPLKWVMRDPGGVVIASGQTRVFGDDPFSGEHVHRIDVMQRIPESGGYLLTAANASSRRFSVSASTYDRLPYDALAFFYHARAGIPIEARFVGEQWSRPAGHPGERAPCLSGLDRSGNRWPGCTYSLDVHGGWYDAGDHGKYLVNGGIALWTLQNAYEVELALKDSRLFADGSARIPEAGNRISDLLDETRWEMEFFMRMQAPDGSHQLLPVGEKRNRPGMAFRDVDTSGMAHHKVADRKWTKLPMRPDQDREERVLYPPSTGATLNLAATAAQCARIWRDIDRAFSDLCLASARRAWKAAIRNPEIYAIANFDGSGGYGDSNLEDEFYWAAAELLATTGEAEFRRFIDASPHFRAPITSPPGWASVGPLGTITLVLNPVSVERKDLDRMKQAIAAAADGFIVEREITGYGVPMAAHWTWGSTSGLLNRAMLLALAYDQTGEPRYRTGVIDVLDFLLGRNPLDRSFISGYGERPMRNPHHRFWAHSLDPAFPPPPAGALSGGPNNELMSDDVARKLKGTCKAQTCWSDDIRAFSLNEVAINWNAPLVWVSAWLAEHRRGTSAN